MAMNRECPIAMSEHAATIFGADGVHKAPCARLIMSSLLEAEEGPELEGAPGSPQSPPQQRGASAIETSIRAAMAAEEADWQAEEEATWHPQKASNSVRRRRVERRRRRTWPRLLLRNPRRRSGTPTKPRKRRPATRRAALPGPPGMPPLAATQDLPRLASRARQTPRALLHLLGLRLSNLVRAAHSTVKGCRA